MVTILENKLAALSCFFLCWTVYGCSRCHRELYFIGVDCDTELKLTGKKKTCVPPDKNIIIVGAKRFRCGEEASGFHNPSFRRFMNVTLTAGWSVV